MAGISTDLEMVRHELGKSFSSKHASEIMDHVHRLPGAPEEAARDSTDSEKIRRALAKHFTSKQVSEIMGHVYCLPRAPNKTARESGFYEAMTHGVSNHVVWQKHDLESLLKAVPAGSVGRPVVDDARTYGWDDPRPDEVVIPSLFRENNVRIVEFRPSGFATSDDLLYLQENHQLLTTLNCRTKDVGHWKIVENLPNLRQLTFLLGYYERPAQDFTVRCRWCNLVELNLDGCGLASISWEIPPMNLKQLELHGMRNVAALDWVSQCTSLNSIRLQGNSVRVMEVRCESLVLPESVTDVILRHVGFIKHLVCGRSAEEIHAEQCGQLESICFRKALEVRYVKLEELRNLARVETPRYMQSLGAEAIEYLKNESIPFSRNLYVYRVSPVTGVGAWDTKMPDVENEFSD